MDNRADHAVELSKKKLLKSFEDEDENDGPWANAHRIQVEEDKLEHERGYYIYPDLYGQPEENGMSHLLFPEELPIINDNKQPKRKRSY